MRKAFVITAIFALVVTLAGAGVFLYGVMTLTPAVVETTVTATPALQVQNVFDDAMDQVAKGVFTGRLYSNGAMPYAQDCTFLTYTVRLKNRGFFPAEWIALTVLPRQTGEDGSCDVLALPDSGAYVLNAGSSGDLSATILTSGDASMTQRALEITCYVFGKKTTLRDNAQ